MMEVKMGMGVRFLGGGESIDSLVCLLYADDLVLCGKSEEDLKVMVGYSVGA